MSEMLSHSDFDLKDIGRKKTAVFLVIQDEKKTYHSLVTIFIKQCYETLIDVAQENGGKLAYKTNFILDEFVNMPPLKDVTTMVTAARSRRIRFTFIIQNFAQLTKVYGKEDGETIRGNCGNLIYLISSELAALEEISKMCGEVKSKEKDKTASTPLVTVSDLQRMPQWTTILLRTRKMPFKTKMTPNFQMEKNNLWGKKYPKATYPERAKSEVPTFDIKDYVDKLRANKQQDMMNMFNPSGGIPGGLPMSGMGAGMPSLFGGQSMMNSETNSGINIDDLVKRIDAKIAEIEEEERREKESLTVSDEVSNLLDEENIIDEDIDDMKLIEEISKDQSTEKEISVVKETQTKEEHDIKQKNTNDQIINASSLEKKTSNEDKLAKLEERFNKMITDDQFFDDFFSDDE